jgi:serine carboxypeptidase-like clade 2
MDNMEAILGWFEKYSDFKTNDLYISGESYGGIYVPWMMYQIDAFNNNQSDWISKVNTTIQHINLKGIMVGNGCTNWTFDTTPAMLNMTYWHALYNDELHDKMVADQCDYSEVAPSNGARGPSKECMDYLTEFDSLTSHIFMYNIFKPVYPDANLLDKVKNHPVLKSRGKTLEMVDGHPILKDAEKKKSFTVADYTPWAM